MRAAWPVDEIRAAEAAAMRAAPDGALMQRAAAGLASRCAQVLGSVYGARVALLVGAGNNGGDALYAGARLARRGARVEALLLAPERAHAGGLGAFSAAGGRSRSADPSQLAGVDLVVDGILGLGGRGGLRPDAERLVTAAAGSGAIGVAVDLPSGVDAGTGAVAGAAFAADLTVTFGCLKAGLLIDPGREHAGLVDVVDIGLGRYLPEARLWAPDRLDVAAWLPVPGACDDKYTRGVVGVASGSAEYGGAAVLSVGGAVRGFAGLVRYSGSVVSAAEAIRARWPEVVVSVGGPAEAGRVQAWVVGPGLGTDEAAEQVVREVLLASDLPVLVDADGLTVLARHPEWLRSRTAETLLTPHEREFARLAGEVGEDRIGAVRRAAATLGATVLLKGEATVIAAPDGATLVDASGTPWLATAGSGDVLSGLAGSLLAGGLPALRAAGAATFLHGLAGRLASRGGPISASDVLRALPDAVRTALA